MYTGNIKGKKGRHKSMPVYPCVYREHGMIKIETIVNLRFIPVYTGNIVELNSLRENCAVYPCVYREHLL